MYTRIMVAWLASMAFTSMLYVTILCVSSTYLKNILQVYTDIYLYIIIRIVYIYIIHIYIYYEIWWNMSSFLNISGWSKTYQTELGPIRKVGICLDPKNPVLPGGAQHSSSVFASFARIAPAVATTSEHKPSRQIFQMIHYSLTFQPRIGASFFAHSGRICGLRESNASYMSCMGLWPPLPPLFPEAPDLMRSKFLHTSDQYETVWKSGWVSGPMRSFNHDWVVDNFCCRLWERKKETNEDSSKLGHGVVQSDSFFVDISKNVQHSFC